MADHVFFFQNTEVLQRDSAGDGVPGICVSVEEIIRVDDLGHLVGHDDAADGLIPGAEAFRDGHDIRCDPHRLTAEPLSGTAKAADDFIRDKQYVMRFVVATYPSATRVFVLFATKTATRLIKRSSYFSADQILLLAKTF